VVTNASATSSATPGTITEAANFPVPAGIWIYEAQLVSSQNAVYFEYYIASAGGASDTTRVAGGFTTTSGIWSRNTGVITNTTGSSATWYLNVKSGTASIAFGAINVTITRIA
jgi:hypothetical protein